MSWWAWIAPAAQPCPRCLGPEQGLQDGGPASLEQLAPAIERRCWGSGQAVRTCKGTWKNGNDTVSRKPSPASSQAPSIQQTFTLGLHCQSQVSHTHWASRSQHLPPGLSCSGSLPLRLTSTQPASPLRTGTRKVPCWLPSSAQHGAGPDEFLLL